MRPPGVVSQESFELAKWVAIAAMAIDHVGKIVVPDWYAPTHLVGRLAFPLFVWIIGSRLAMRPEAALGYMRWLLPWALVSQPAFYIAGRDWYDGNILFTLLAGVIVVYLTDRLGWTSRVLAIVMLLAVLGVTLDYGPAGVIAIPVITTAARAGPAAGLGALAVVAVIVNFPFSTRFDGLAAAAALGAVAVAALSVNLGGGGLARLPRAFFYAFYPAHLLVLAGLARLLAA